MKIVRESTIGVDEIILLVAVVLVVLGGCYITYYYITEKINTCSANPLKYIADQISSEKNLTYSYVHFGMKKSATDPAMLDTVEMEFDENGRVIFDSRYSKKRR